MKVNTIKTFIIAALCCCILHVCGPFCNHAEAEACVSEVEVEFSIDGLSVDITSSKDLSNVVLQFCDGTVFKFDGLSGKEGTFTKGKTLDGVWVKSGCNFCQEDADGVPFCGPGYGEFFDTDCPECEGEVDECGICMGTGPNECGSCDGSIVKDECGVCGGEGPGDCGCDLNIIRDECGICGGTGPGACGCGDIVKDECGVCGGDGPGPCGCDLSIKQDVCGICDGDGRDDCGNCPQDEEKVVKDKCGICGGDGTECPPPPPPPYPTPTPTPDPCPEGYDVCGICDGSGKDSCGLCPGEEGHGTGECIDCLGIPFGPHVEDPVGACCEHLTKDECGFCDGTGKDSCGLCPQDENYDKGLCACENLENPVELDTMANTQHHLAKMALRAFVRSYKASNGSLPKKLRKKLQRLSDRSHSAHIESWTIVWLDFGKSTLVCPEDTSCEQVSLAESKETLINNSRLMHKIVKRFVKKAIKLSGKRRYNRLFKESLLLRKMTDQLVATLPDHKSLCDE